MKKAGSFKANKSNKGWRQNFLEEKKQLKIYSRSGW